jgi:hypothetical protein
MGWFNKILVVNSKTGDIQDITDLDRKHYESFLEAMQRLIIAYDIASKKEEELKNKESC